MKEIDDAITNASSKAPLRAQLAQTMTTNNASFNVDNIRATQPGQTAPSITTAKNIWNLAGHDNDEVWLVWDETEGDYVFDKVILQTVALMTNAEDNGTTAVTGDRQTTRVMTSGSEASFTIFTTTDC